MYLTLSFTLAEEDEETAAYEEQVEGGKPSVIGTISLRKSAFTTPLPPVLRISLSYHAAGPALSQPPGSTPSPRAVPSKALEAGDTVTVIKNQQATVTSPPEWLEQYLGKAGIVLWTTPSGAMVDLTSSVTWFPYAELERGDPEPR